MNYLVFMVESKKDTDINPQFISDWVTMSGINTYTSKTINLPVNPGATITKGKVRVMEFLKVYIDFTFDTLVQNGYILVQLTYKEQAAALTALDVQKWIVKMGRKMQVLGAAAAIFAEVPFMADLTDGNGNGILIGQQQIFLGVMTGGQAAAQSCAIKVLYRFKDVPVEEYIGMVQGQ
jgi:hypothetical protein